MGQIGGKVSCTEIVSKLANTTVRFAGCQSLTFTQLVSRYMQRITAGVNYAALTHGAEYCILSASKTEINAPLWAES